MIIAPQHKQKYPVGSEVITPTGRKATVIGHTEALIKLRYEGVYNRDVVDLAPKLCRKLT